MERNLWIPLASFGPEKVENSQSIKGQVNNIVTIEIGKPHLLNNMFVS